MVLLVLFAFVAGAGTALSPCVLPVLPALLASAGSGGRRRPLGVIAGLTATFTIAIVALASVVDGVGLSGGTVRTLAVVVLLGYAAGSALVLLLVAHGGRRVLDRLRAAGRGPLVQRVLGAVMVATAVAVATDLDVRFQTALADDFPEVLVNPTRALERSGAVEDRLADLHGGSRFEETAEARTAGLPVLGPAPDFTGNDRWVN